MLNNNKIHHILKESIRKVLNEVDRHRDGYYEDYAEKTGKKDRHSPGYYKEYYAKKKQEKENTKTTPNNNKKKKIDRREYYRKYNQAHPERLNRGFTKGYRNGNVNDGPNTTKVSDNIILGYDEFGMPITNHPLSDALRNHETIWHDDDWQEDVD